MPDPAEAKAMRASILTPEVERLRGERERIIEETLVAECGPALPESMTRQLQQEVEERLQGVEADDLGQSAYFTLPGTGKELFEVAAYSSGGRNEVRLYRRYPTRTMQSGADGKWGQTGRECMASNEIASIWLNEPGSTKAPRMNTEGAVEMKLRAALEASGNDFAPLGVAAKQLRDQLGEVDMELYNGGDGSVGQRGLREKEQDEVGMILTALAGQRLNLTELAQKRKEVFGDLN